MVCDACGKEFVRDAKARIIERIDPKTSKKTGTKYTIHSKNHPNCRGLKVIRIPQEELKITEIIIV